MISWHRLAHRLHLAKIPLVPKLLYILNRILFGIVLPPSVRLGKDVLLGYQGLGTVIHARTIIGDRVNIGPGVTIGGRSGMYDVPIIEADVILGAGCKILGPIKVGRGALIGANAVVIGDVPAFATAVGVPARIIPRSDQDTFTVET